MALLCLFIPVIVHLASVTYFVASYLVVFCSMPHQGSMNPWSLSCHWISTIDPVGKKRHFCEYLHLYLLGVVCYTSTVCLLSSLLHTVGGLLNLSDMPHDGLLNRSAARLGNQGWSVFVFSVKDIHESALV